jgi:hypothetical protein
VNKLMDTKKILFITSPVHSDSPAQQRITAFQYFFLDFMYTFEQIPFPVTAYQILNLIYKIYKYNFGTIFVSMPPFRCWWILFLPSIIRIFDWRDGWSIAMRTGYGKTFKDSKFKSLFAKFIELFAFFRANIIVTCTPGLYNYHSKGLPAFLAKKLILIPNGHNIKINKDDFKPFKPQIKNILRVICAGKFSEYGALKATKVIDTLLTRYSGHKISLTIIGASIHENEWLMSSYNNLSNFKIQILSRLDYQSTIQMIKNCDLTAVVIRDDTYDFGTKVFDYIACGKPVLDVFDQRSIFRKYFSYCFDTDYCPSIAEQKAVSFKRLNQIKSGNFLHFINTHNGA